MMIADGVDVLPIPRNSQGAAGFLNLTLILDEQNGNTLVDAGLPGQAEAIGAALVEAGIGVRDLRRIIFTHQDLDHVGSGANTRTPERCTSVGAPRRCPPHRRKPEAAQAFARDARTKAADARGLRAPRTRRDRRAPGGR